MNRKKTKNAFSNTLSNLELCKIVREKPGVRGVRVISPSDVTTAPWVRLKCRFGCSGYDQSYVCPPFTPSPDQMRAVLDSYRRAMLIHFDATVNIKATVVDLERTIFLRGAWKAFGLGAGPCEFCKTCNVHKGDCRHPERARPSMEACGIDVFTTARKAGFPIEVVRSTRQCPNFYGLILVD